MLEKLSIRNYALIHEMEMDFRSGLTIITGETGSGKSILLDALGLLLGERADTSVLRDKNTKCILEAKFNIGKYGLEEFFKDHDLDYDIHCIVRRELSPQGKTRAFINDTPVNLTQLKILGSRLVDIHSQHDSLQLSNSDFLLHLLDGAAGNESFIKKYKNHFIQYSEISRRLADLKEEQARFKQEEDFIRFQHNELAELNPAEGEEELLENEMDALRYADKIREQLEACAIALDQSEIGAIASVYKGLQSVQSISSLSVKAAELSERIKSVHIELKDILLEVEALASYSESNPLRLKEIELRWDKLNHAMQKHRVNSAAELILIKKNLEEKLEKQLDLNSDLGDLEKKQAEAQQIVLNLAEELHMKRLETADPLRKNCLDLLGRLGMPKAQLEFKLQKTARPDISGMSQIQLLFSANAGQEMKELSKVASGGEFSRLMLSLKKILAESADLPSIIFDEIDTGVSGAIADKMGELLETMSKRMQVLVITHLPQIAGKGTDHLKVLKTESEDKTISRLSRLNAAERVDEIAGMLSGTALTEAARTHAKTLLGL